MQHTTKLIKDIVITEDHTGQLEENVKIVRTDLSDLHRKLYTSKKVNESLNHLNSSLNTAEKLLTVVSIIPKIRTVAGKMNTTIKQFHKPIESALKASNKLEEVIKPIRDSIEKLEPKLEKLDQGLLETMNIENNSKDAFCSASKCINSLPDSEQKTLLHSELEKFAKNLDPKVLEFDKIQVTILSSVEEVKNYSDQIAQWVEQLIYLNIEINNVINILNPLISALLTIEKALKEVIRVPYGGYPDFCTENILGVEVPYPCGWVTVYFSFSIQQILDGITGVIQPVLDLLDEAMNAILDPLLNALNLNLELPTIPNLNILDILDDKLEELFNKLLSKVDIDIDLHKFIKELREYIEYVLKINTQCLIATKG